MQHNYYNSEENEDNEVFWEMFEHVKEYLYSNFFDETKVTYVSFCNFVRQGLEPLSIATTKKLWLCETFLPHVNELHVRLCQVCVEYREERTFDDLQAFFFSKLYYKNLSRFTK